MLRAFAPDRMSRGHGQPPWISVQLGCLAVTFQVTGPAGTEEQALQCRRALGAAASTEFIQCLCTERPLCTRPYSTFRSHRAPGLVGTCPRVHCVPSCGFTCVSEGGWHCGPPLSTNICPLGRGSHFWVRAAPWGPCLLLTWLKAPAPGSWTAGSPPLGAVEGGLAPGGHAEGPGATSGRRPEGAGLTPARLLCEARETLPEGAGGQVPLPPGSPV